MGKAVSSLERAALLVNKFKNFCETRITSNCSFTGRRSLTTRHVGRLNRVACTTSHCRYLFLHKSSNWKQWMYVVTIEQSAIEYCFKWSLLRLYDANSVHLTDMRLFVSVSVSASLSLSLSLTHKHTHIYIYIWVYVYVYEWSYTYIYI